MMASAFCACLELFLQPRSSVRLSASITKCGTSVSLPLLACAAVSGSMSESALMGCKLGCYCRGVTGPFRPEVRCTCCQL